MGAALLLALGLCAWQLSLPGHLLGVTQYDDGVYLGAALRLVHGVLPYRDFVFVQPPGIVLLMSPVALLGRLAGAPVALAAARVLTGVVAGLDAGLAAWLLRHRGRAAMAVAGSATALFPLAVAADHTLLLEPYLVAFVLGGLAVAASAGPAARGRLAVAGALLGVAGAVKLWAVFPFLALLATEVVRSRRRAAWLAAGTAAGFGACCLPFAAAAPGAFVRQVLLAQLGRGASAHSAVPVGARLAALLGLSGLRGVPASAALAAGLLAVLAALVGAALLLERAAWRREDTVLVAAAVLSVAGLLAAPDFYPHYAYFTAPFLAALLAIGVTGTARGVAARLLGAGRDRARRLARRALLAAGGALVVALAANDVAYATSFLPSSLRDPSGAVIDPGPKIARVVAPGACVVADDPVLAIEADRFSSRPPGCPALVDAYGRWLVAGHGSAPLAPPDPPRLVATWRSDLARAGDVVLTGPGSAYVPWTPGLQAWFAHRFRPVLVVQGTAVYAPRRPSGRRSSPGAG